MFSLLVLALYYGVPWLGRQLHLLRATLAGARLALDSWVDTLLAPPPEAPDGDAAARVASHHAL